MTKEQEDAIETMKHWIDYEKENRNKINKADKLIGIQETILNMLKEKDKKIEKKDRQIKLMAQTILEDTSKLKTFWCNGCTQIANCPYKEAVDCIEDFFERKSEE